MSAKLTLIGQPNGLQVKDGVATFAITTGPAVHTAPKGLPMFGQVLYQVRCAERQLNRARTGTGDTSELVIEGYIEPHFGGGRASVAVVATAIVSKAQQAQRKAEQLRAEVEKAETAYDEACGKYGVGSPAAAGELDTLESLKAGLAKFMAGHPELG